MPATSPYAYIAAGHHQIAFVVKDIQAAERFFTDKMGVPHFFRFNDVQVYEAFYRGGPGDFHMHLSLGYAGDSQIELIEHISGRSIYKEFLDGRGEGLHHLGFIVPDHEKVIADFVANGFPVIQSGRIGNNPGVKFAYFDTEAVIGAVMESIVLDDDTRRLFEKLKGGKI
jgi:catechol 2,3-dioxygenase-like lactoylglutathione lyase family enzyme